MNLPKHGVVNHITISMRKQSANDINDIDINDRVNANQDCDRKIAATTPKKRCVSAVPSKGIKSKTVPRITLPKCKDKTYVGKQGKKNVTLSYTLRSSSKKESSDDNHVQVETPNPPTIPIQ